MERVVLNALPKIMRLCRRISAPSATLVIVFGEADPPSMHGWEWIDDPGASLALAPSPGHASTSVPFPAIGCLYVAVRLRITEFAIVVERVVLNALADIPRFYRQTFAPSATLVIVFGEANPPVGAPRFFKMFFCFSPKHVRQITT